MELETKLSNQEIVKIGTSCTGINRPFTFKKNRLNSRVKELLWDGSVSTDLSLFERVLNSLSNDLNIGTNEDISVEEDGLKGIKIYPTNLSEEIGGLDISRTTHHITHHIFRRSYIEILVKSGKNVYGVKVFNKRPYLDELHKITLGDLK